jgi:two-component system phosphate regulon sensor histidine kinase PhoR
MGDAHINFHFPNKGFYIAKQIGWMLSLSILGILIIVGCFAYTILTIRKQKKLAEMKNDFINNMTHEFKTPIFSISLASKALGKSPQVQQSDKLNSYLNLIHDESKRLKGQVDKVLQMTLANSDYSKINKEKVNLHELIKNVSTNFDLILSEKNGDISLDLHADRHIIYADKTHLTNIIQNLIDNAIKYSKREPDITISTEDQGDGVSFSITDNGIGMDADTKEHIFDKFYRAQSGDIHDVKGFGLGLSYVKNIVEAHKGRIKLNSKLNKGSTFTIFLPT